MSSLPSSKLRALLQQMRRITEDIERGQSEKPLEEACDQLTRDVDVARFDLVLIGLTPEARNAFLARLISREFHYFRINAPPHVNLIEIHLQEQGYVLETAPHHRIEFDRVATLLEALGKEQPGAVDLKDWAESLSLRVPVPEASQGVRILIPESLGKALDNPSCLARLTGVGSAMVVSFENRDAARAWANEDPYLAGGVYERVDVYPFIPVLP